MPQGEAAAGAPARSIRFLPRLSLLGFYPLYLCTTGIYPGIRDAGYIEPGGLVFPIALFLGVGLSLYLLGRMAARREIGLPKPLICLIVLLFGMSLILSLAGTWWSGHFIHILLFGQSLAGAAGIGLAVFFIDRWKLDFEDVAGFISRLFLIQMALHIAWSYHAMGPLTFFGRELSHRTPLGGIYQILVYYPYIVSAVFWFAAPYWRRTRWFVLVYLAAGLYVYLFQVRGALVSYICVATVYVLGFSAHRRRNAVIIASLWLAGLMVVYFTNINIGRLSFSNVGERELFWLQTFDAIRKDWRYLIYGTLYNATNLRPDFTLVIESAVGSMHNQYLDFLKFGGFLLLGAYGVGILVLLLAAVRNAQKLHRAGRDRMIYWFPALIVVQSVLDMNANTPLRAVNPGVYFWFYWVGSYLYLHRLGSETP